MGAAIGNNMMTVDCTLQTDNDGQFAGLVPQSFVTAAASRQLAFAFATDLVDTVDGKGFNPDHHELATPGVPAGATDLGVHCSTHNAKFNGGPLSPNQIQQIQNCNDVFRLTVNTANYKVLVGSPSNDASTGVLGYVGILLTEDSLPEYNRAMAIYGGKVKTGNIAHVSVCGWNIKGFESTTDARRAFGLVTEDGQKYPDGMPFYNANVFPTPIQ